ncbi:MAG: PEGA domain-containing protein [Myxococcales bacterium]|nr:PEGA domain-containing protein [Myxococcales bacterium]
MPQPTEMSRTLTSRRWPLLAVASVAVSSIAVLGFLLLRQGGALGSRAVVQLSSEPSGATVVFNGAPLPELTPCTLPKVPAGSYPIRVGKVGYLDHQGTVDVPSSGEVRLPPIKLLPDRPPPPEPQVSLRVASTLPAEVSVDGEPVGQTPLEIQVAPGRRKLALLVQTGERSECEVIAQGGRPVSLSWAGGGCREGDPSSVMLTVRSQPHGAELYVDGLAQGQTPLTVEVEPKRELSIRLELAGYKLAERRVETGLGAPRELSVELERRGQSSVKVVDRRDPPKASGLVRFAVTPWAEVACGGHDFGPTPFKDRSLPVGEYECRFTHPELGTRTERVVVRANETSRVTVKF